MGKDNIKMDLMEIVWDVVDHIHLAEDKEKRRALVKTEMNFRLTQNMGNLTEDILASQEGLCIMTFIFIATFRTLCFVERKFQ
jgi:hypothetical protein